MSKIYTTPFDWGYVDDNTLIYNDTSEEAIKEMINEALDEAMEDVKEEVVDEALSSMDIKLEGGDLLYKLIVNGNENGEINIPKDQFLKTASYDKDAKKLVFVMETTDGETTTEVNISDLVSAIEEKNVEQDTELDAKADKSELEQLATKEEVAAVDAKVDAIEIPSIDNLATKEEVAAVDAKVDAIEIPSVEGLATKEEVAAVDAKVDAIEIPSIDNLATKEEVENKVDWVESTPGRKHIVLSNHDSVLGTATDGQTYNVAMVSKWDVADFGSSQLHLNLNSKDGIATINDDKAIATEDFVSNSIASAVESLATKEEVDTAAASAVAQVVANAPEDFDTLKEVADYIASDKTKASEIETKLGQHDTALETKADKSELEQLATKEEVAAVDAKVDAIEIPSIEGLAVASEVTAEIAAAVADKADVSALDNLATKEEVQAVDTKVDALEIPSIEGLAKSADVTAEIAAAVEPLATKEEVENKVDWVESTPDRKHIVLKNHDSVLGTATDGQTYNVAMVSKWDVADFGSTQLHLNLNSKDGVATINDDKVIATEGFVADSIANAIEPLATKEEVTAVDAKVDAIEIPSIEGLAKSADVTAEIATAIAPLAVKSEMTEEVNAVSAALADFEADTNVALNAKANAADVYTKTESDEIFQVSGDYVPVEDYNALAQKVAALENYVNIFIKDREEKMDEIINNMDADNKEVVIETPMESIVVPETTVAYTITAPLADNSTVELTSPKYMTLYNTSEEPVSSSIGHTFVEGESTSATTVYLVGDFDTLTLENVSPAVKSGEDAASVNNVVITENNVKNLTLALDIQDGATITNNSNASITIQDKNDMATTLTIVAPNSTVTLNGSNYEVVNATVSDNTLVIKKNVSHIGTLNVSKGNVIVEVPRQSLIAEKIDQYTLAEGYTIDYLHDEINSSNVSNLAKEGSHTLVEDVAKSGNFSVGTFSTDDMIWDLNGHSITSSNTRGYGIFRLRGSAHLEINDSVGTGSVVNTDDDYGLWTGTADSKIVINGGHFEASTHVLYAEKGTIEVNGGSFRLTNEDTADKDEFGNFKFLVNCHDADYTSGDAKIIIRGGKFYGWNPSASYGEPGGPVSFVAEGYGVVESTEMIDGVEHKVFEVKPINE